MQLDNDCVVCGYEDTEGNHHKKMGAKYMVALQRQGSRHTGVPGLFPNDLEADIHHQRILCYLSTSPLNL